MLLQCHVGAVDEDTQATKHRDRVRALGEDVQRSFTPAQEVVRIVRNELIQILGGEAALLTFSKEYPTVFLIELARPLRSRLEHPRSEIQR